jgi:hypothetical protein
LADFKVKDSLKKSVILSLMTPFSKVSLIRS